MSEVLCEVCRQTKAWHEEHRPQHEFSLDGQLRRAQPMTVEAPMPNVSIPSDPILRLVLIEKGLITSEDLAEAEAKLRSTGVLIARQPPETARAETPVMKAPKKVKGMDGRRR
jgi:hypothetical protein